MNRHSFLYLFLILLGACAHQGGRDSSREPAAEAAALPSLYQDSLSCQAAKEHRVYRLSAISGFRVGPTAQKMAPDPTKEVLRPFYSDGCSLSPDGIPLTEKSQVWNSCCIKHDMSYWLGGSEEDKKRADDEFRTCMTEKGYPEVAKIYHLFVSQLGGPQSSHTFRWAYGWNFKRNYAPLSDREVTQVEMMYKTGIEDIISHLENTSFPLIRQCDTYDPAFSSLTDEEISVYKYMNANLRRNETIEWAKWKNYKTGPLRFEVKLYSCQTPIEFHFVRSAIAEMTVVNNCLNVDLR